VALAAQVPLPCIQGQADGIASVINRGGAQVEVGCVNVVEIEMPETPISGVRIIIIIIDTPLEAIGSGGNSDWNFSLTSLRLAVGL
jgi:hypothetical protein